MFEYIDDTGANVSISLRSIDSLRYVETDNTDVFCVWLTSGRMYKVPKDYYATLCHQLYKLN